MFVRTNTIYNEADFFSVKEVMGFLEKNAFQNIVVFQTVFKSPGEIKKTEKPAAGFGRGGFVVVCGNKEKINGAGR